MIEAVAASQGRSLSTRYTLIEKLGAGGQAEVWRARDEVAGVEVAVKILSPLLAHNEAAWDGLVREHSIASQLNHPAILKVQPPYREGDFVALPMELASGGDLRRLRGKGYLDIIPVLIDIAQGLEYAHENGVIHRDLKPGNVLFDIRGQVRIADFGIAGAPGEATPGVMRPGLSPFTASPEQLRGDPPAVTDDVYGLGALAYELLSGYPPYYPRFEVKRVLEEPVPELKPAHLMPPQLVVGIMRMLSKRASLRPQSMREVIDDFDSALNDTLTFDFDRVEEPDSSSGTRRRDAAVVAAAEAARRAASAPAEPHAAARRRSPAAEPPKAPIQRPSQGSGRGTTPPKRPNVPDVTVTGAIAKRFEPITASRSDSSGARKASPEMFAGSAADGTGVVVEQGPTAPRADSRVETDRIAAAAAAVRDAAPHLATPARTAPTDWDDVRLRAEPFNPRRARDNSRRSWPWVLFTAVAVAVMAFYLLSERLPALGGLIDKVAGRSSGKAAASTAAIVTQNTPPAASGAAPAETIATPDDSIVAAKPEDVPPVPGATAGPGDAPVADANAGTVSRSVPAPTAARAPAREPAKPPVKDDSVSAAAVGDRLAKARANFGQRLAALEARGAGFWGGSEFGTAKTRAAESVGAFDAGSTRLAQDRLNEGLRLLSSVEAKAGPALAEQLATGDRALAAGQAEVAKQAYEFARRIDPNNARASDGLQRVRNLGGVLPLLADGANAEAAKDYARAVQDYSQALSLDPNNVAARAGIQRAHAGFGEDSYAKAVGSGFASLGAGRLDDARVSFEKARSIRPNGTEAATGLSRVGAALSARGYAGARQKGASLEAEERWTEAVTEYEAALQVDPSLVFAQQGRIRALERAGLSNSLQALIDRPERLATPSVRVEADALLRRADDTPNTGPVLRSQIQRLRILLPEFDIPVKLALVSDNATRVQIQRVGEFGAFARREIELKPGKYTVVGTRPGFRDVRRDVTIAPGRDVQTISVSCIEPI
ncbi:MAG: protein kinase [Gammaproteobacteria bacterium]